MKIAVILPSLANKGPILVAYDLCIEYIKMGHQCKVFYFDDITEVTFPCEVQQISFKEKVDFSGFDVIHSHMFRPDVYLVRHGYHRSDIPIVSTVHQHIGNQFKFSDSGKPFFAVIKWLWIILLRKFNKVVILNSSQESFYQKFGLKTKVIYNGRSVDFSKTVDESDIEALEEFASKYTVIGSIAYVTKRKGLDQIIHALKKDSGLGFLVVGDGPEIENLQQLADSLEVRDRVLFLGSRPAGYRYLKYIDVFALPSYAEGFPLSLIESFSYGVPAVCSRIDDVSSVLSEDQVSYFNLNDIDSLMSAISKVQENHKDRCEDAKKLYEEQFSPEMMASKYISLYNNLNE